LRREDGRSDNTARVELIANKVHTIIAFYITIHDIPLISFVDKAIDDHQAIRIKRRAGKDFIVTRIVYEDLKAK